MLRVAAAAAALLAGGDALGDAHRPAPAPAPPPPPPVARARMLVARMNATEKMTLLSGVYGLGWAPPEEQALHGYVGNVPSVPRLGIPWLSLQDGPQGFRDGKYGKGAFGKGEYLGTSTQWPSGLTIGATWDPELAGEWGAGMGAEFRLKGANVQLGPGLNVARVPQGGRNFE
jgi:beta-glucosidase